MLVLRTESATTTRKRQRKTTIWSSFIQSLAFVSSEFSHILLFSSPFSWTNLSCLPILRKERLSSAQKISRSFMRKKMNSNFLKVGKLFLTYFEFWTNHELNSVQKTSRKLTKEKIRTINPFIL